MPVDRPNILFIISDQHNAKCLGVAGHPDAKTPNLDRLAAEGVRFTHCVTQNPICTPSRMSYLTGQYCHNHGYYGLTGPCPHRLPSLFRFFREAGYRTGALGKIHCPENWVEPDCDTFLEAYGPGAAYQAYLEGIGRAEDRDDDTLQEWTGGGQGLDARCSRLEFEHCVEGWCAAEGMRFLERQDGRPFFLQLSLPRPHETYVPSEPFWSLYDEQALTLPPNADYDLSRKPPHFRRIREWQSAPNAGTWLFEPRTYEAGRRRVLRGYLGCVSQVDHAVGLVLAKLAELGLAENTVVVYTADHGDFAGEHGILEKAPGICADAITRVPQIWRWPGRFPAGVTCDQLTEAVDLAPTVAALSGLGPFGVFDGHDLTPLLEGGEAPLRDIAVCENPWSRVLYTTRFRYVHYQREMFGGEEVGELYELAEDPWEMRSLYSEPEYQPVVHEMQRRLLDFLIRTTRPVTVHPPLGEGAQDYGAVEDATAFAEDGKAPTGAIEERARRGWVFYL